MCKVNSICELQKYELPNNSLKWKNNRRTFLIAPIVVINTYFAHWKTKSFENFLHSLHQHIFQWRERDKNEIWSFSQAPLNSKLFKDKGENTFILELELCSIYFESAHRNMSLSMKKKLPILVMLLENAHLKWVTFWSSFICWHVWTVSVSNHVYNMSFFLELVQNHQKIVSRRDAKLTSINETYQEEQGYEVGIGRRCYARDSLWHAFCQLRFCDEIHDSNPNTW